MSVEETALRIIKSTRDLDSRNRKNVDQIIAELDKLAKNELRDHAEDVLLMWVEYVLRTSSTYCALAGMQMVEWLDKNLVSSEGVLGVLARWERSPVEKLDTNLGAGVYEHLIERGEAAEVFRQWKKDPCLRKRYILVGYCLDDSEAIELYEWAINQGEIDAVKDSLRAISPPRHVCDRKRWERILNIVGLPLSTIVVEVPPPSPPSDQV